MYTTEILTCTHTYTHTHHKEKVHVYTTLNYDPFDHALNVEYLNGVIIPREPRMGAESRGLIYCT